jgi:sphingomyelin phosphodiesterase acid-like 3
MSGSKWQRAGWATSLLACVLAACAQAQGPKTAATVEVLSVSDIHLDPFHDPAKAERLAAAPITQWRAILDAPDSADRATRSAAMLKSCPARSVDTDEALFAASLQAMHAQARGLRFATVSGDLMAHQFDCRFRQVFPKATVAEYRSFALKTMAYELAELRKALPGVPVYAALGNNDSDCGDYKLDAHGAFLAGAAPFFLADLPATERTAATERFAIDGSYVVPLPGTHARLVVLDDLFASRGYTGCAGKPDPAPAAAQAAWLQAQIDAARSSGEKLWVMGHIPPGIDPYATVLKLRNVCGGEEPVLFLSSAALGEALSAGGDVVTLALFAHTHMDEMHLLEGARGPVALKMVPSISPINGNLPAFTLSTIDAVTASVKDFRVISSADNRGSSWAESYDFAHAYGAPGFSSADAATLLRAMAADTVAGSAPVAAYLSHYYGRDLSPALKPFWPQYACSMSNLTAEAYRSCLCGKRP